MNLFANILNKVAPEPKSTFLSGFTPTKPDIFTGKTTSEKIASGEIKSRKLSPQEMQSSFGTEPAFGAGQGGIGGSIMRKISKSPSTFNPNKNLIQPVFTGIQNQQRELESRKVVRQSETEKKIDEITNDLAGQGYNEEQIMSVFDDLNKEGFFKDSPGIIEGMSQRLYGSLSGGVKEYQDAQSSPYSATESILRSGTTIPSSLVEAPFNALFGGAIESGIEKSGLQPTVQAIGEGYNQFAQANPRLAFNLGTVGNMATVATPPIAKKAGGIVSKPIKGASNAMKSIPNPISGAKNVVTRKIPVGIMERDLSLTPTERASIETINGKPAGAVALEYNLPKDKQAMVDVLSTKADDAYNGITADLKNVTARTDSSSAKEMLGIMLDEMQNSPILVRTMNPYMTKLGEMMKQADFSLSEKNAIRRDFDRIVANKIFDSKGRVSGIEDKAIANIREGLSKELQQEALKYGIDIKSKNDILRTSISLRDGVLRRLSQENKNNKIGIQDIGVGAIFGAGDPLTTASVIFGKKILESSAPSIAQKLYNSNKTPYATSNMKRGVTISPRDTTNGLSITPDNVSPVRVQPLALPPPSGKATGAKNFRASQPKEKSPLEKVNKEGIKDPRIKALDDYKELESLGKEVEKADSFNKAKARENYQAKINEVKMNMSKASYEKAMTKEMKNLVSESIRQDFPEGTIDVFNKIRAVLSRTNGDFTAIKGTALKRQWEDITKAYTDLNDVSYSSSQFYDFVKDNLRNINTLKPRKISPAGPSVFNTMGKRVVKKAPESPVALERGYTTSVKKPIVKRSADVDGTLYHGSSSMRELKDFDLDISMQKAKQGSGIGGSFAEGPGIYLTSSKSEAMGYGHKVSEFSTKLANIVDKNTKAKLSRQEVSNILSKIDKNTMERAINDWGTKNDLINNILEQGNTYEQLMDIWASVFSQQNPKGYVDAVKSIGIDGLKIPKEGTTHYVIYNPDKFIKK